MEVLEVLDASLTTEDAGRQAAGSSASLGTATATAGSTAKTRTAPSTRTRTARTAALTACCPTSWSRRASKRPSEETERCRYRCSLQKVIQWGISTIATTAPAQWLPASCSTAVTGDIFQEHEVKLKPKIAAAHGASGDYQPATTGIS
ncbi:hypothetical protein C2845_PM07G23480 [Panicum miliaceum]|uniref:Uncharacterized protein n=1 Tax=Panicum miliaceum TaxID=4540 RepID=A0A3L6SRH6_PANMI|nr:hypothetical protein C2845_PM07G23480 [Panicum miliaceum]